MEIQYSDTGFILSQNNKAGVIEGSARIHLSAGNAYYFYDVILVNDSNPIKEVNDYRSPKTVNPDSNLTQQKIIFATDQWRNIVLTDQTPNYFEEDIISIQPKAGIYQAQVSKPLTSFYVQPGSCTSLPIQTILNPDGLAFEVTAGPLQDRYYNTVADGTIVTFVYYDDDFTYHEEVSLRDGFATTIIPATNVSYALFAKVHETQSKEIQLQP